MNVLLVGSGKSSEGVLYRNLDGIVVCAINNAWRIPYRLDYSIFSGDWKPFSGRASGVDNISHKQYDSKDQKESYGSMMESGIGATMFFNAAYWILSNLKPDNLGMIGCSMYYPSGDAGTFYGSGNPDPLRFSEGSLFKWFDAFYDASARGGCTLANLGSDKGFMTYPKVSLESWMGVLS